MPLTDTDFDSGSVQAQMALFERYTLRWLKGTDGEMNRAETTGESRCEAAVSKHLCVNTNVLMGKTQQFLTVEDC